MTTIIEYDCLTLTFEKLKTRSNKIVHNHPIIASGTYDNNDHFICSNKKDIKKWLKCAKEKGTCEGLTYHPAYKTKNFFGKITEHPATYTYDTNWGDTAQSVREMFNLKHGALMKYNKPINSVTEPFQCKTITFDESDIIP